MVAETSGADAGGTEPAEITPSTDQVPSPQSAKDQSPSPRHRADRVPRQRRRVTTEAVPGTDPSPQNEPARHPENENDERLKADKPPHWG